MRSLLVAVVLLVLPLTPIAEASSTTHEGTWDTGYLQATWGNLRQDGPHRTTPATLSIEAPDVWRVDDPHESFGCVGGGRVWYEYEGQRFDGTGDCHAGRGADGAWYVHWHAPLASFYPPELSPFGASYGSGNGRFV